MLRPIKGIGPWTVAVILLRGLGRLDDHHWGIVPQAETV